MDGMAFTIRRLTLETKRGEIAPLFKNMKCDLARENVKEREVEAKR